MAAELSSWVRARNLNTTLTLHPSWAASTKACLRRVDLISRKNKKKLVKISTSSDGKWSDKWNTRYTFSLRELQLQDLAIEDQNSPETSRVSISLHVQQHASFGLSVEGKIIAYFTTKCSSCSSPYCRKIDTDFNVLILSAKRRNNDTQVLPEIGGDDQVIYVKPGYEADLDSLIQDTIRLATSVKDTCSESCEKTAPKIQYVGDNKKNSAYIDPRWSRLLELRNAIQK